MFRKVIVGVDGREGGMAAAQLAARLHVPHVVHACVCPYEAHPLRWALPDYPARLRADAHRMLRRLQHELGVEATSSVVLDLSPARALHRLADEEHADAIVVGPCRHPHAASRVALGDVAAAVIADAPCAVVIARPATRRPDDEPMRIGVAFDGSAESDAALRLAESLAHQTGATLLLRTVIDQLPPLSIGVPTSGLTDMWPPQPDMQAWAAIVERMRTDAISRLDDALDTISSAAATGEVIAGAPGDELIGLSREVDLIVCGSRGWGAVRRVLLGSVSDRLARHAECPVIVAPRPDVSTVETPETRAIDTRVTETIATRS